MIGDQNPNPAAPPKSNKGPERREQWKRQEKSDCKRGNEEELECQDH